MLLEGLNLLQDYRLHSDSLEIQNGFLFVEVLRVAIRWCEGEGIRKMGKEWEKEVKRVRGVAAKKAPMKVKSRKYTPR